MPRSFTRNFITKIGILFAALLVSGLIGLVSHGHAATSPDVFSVEVQPSSMEANQAVDLTVTARTANGDVVTDYQGDVFIEIDGIADTADYVVPSEGLYTFLPQDQGTKQFSKGLIVKKQGTFAVKVSDIINEAIQGQKTIIVGSDHNVAPTENITISSPADAGIEKNNVVNVIASSPELPNSPYEVYLNNEIVSQGTTDIIGDINVYISGVIVGSNTLQVKISNSQNEIIGASQSITFTYSPIKDGVFNSIQILPSSKIKQGNKARFIVSTSDSVTSAEIKLSNGRSAPMDRETAGIFNKEMTIDTEGEIGVSVNLIQAGQTKSYTGVATLVVEKNITIGKIRLYSDSVDKSKLTITWETVGIAPKYKVQYGTSENLLDEYVITPINEIIIDNLVLGQKYYFQITALNEDEQPLGPTSAVTEATIGEDLSCVVKGITISDQKIGDKYYIVWTGVANIDSYIIYRSEFDTNDTSKMQKVGTTTGTMFEYPFNKLSKKDEYAFYVVEAVCKDGTNLKIDSALRVKVGPVENILLFIVISIFGYCIFKLYKYSKD